MGYGFGLSGFEFSSAGIWLQPQGREMRVTATLGGIASWSDPSRSATSYYLCRGPCPGFIPRDYLDTSVSQVSLLY